MNGFERELNNRILAVVPHGEIEAVNQPWNNWQEALDKVQKVPGIVAAAPYINFTGLVESGANLRAVQVKGVDPKQEQRLSALPSFVQNHAWDNFKAGEQQIIIGKGIADALKVKQGDWVSIMIPNASADHKLQQPKRVRLHVTGLKSQISVHKSIFREVFCHIYDKIPRHTGQNAITVGDLKCILAKCCERSEQQLNQAAITIFYSSLVRI